MSFKVHEKRDGYFVVRRAHPLGNGETLTKQGRDKVVLELWAREIESIAAKFKAGVISAAMVVEAIAKMEGESMTVGEAWADYMNGKRISDGSRTAYETTWRLYLQDTWETKRLAEVTEQSLIAWEAKQRQKITKRKNAPSQNTLGFAWRLLKYALKKQIRAGRLARETWGSYHIAVTNYKKTLQRETLRTPDEMYRLVKAAAEYDATHANAGWGDLAHRLVVLLTTGLRNAELGAVGWDDVLRRGAIPMLRLRFQVKNNWHIKHPDWERPRDPLKSKKTYELPLHVDALRALRAQMNAQKIVTACGSCGALVGELCVAGCNAPRGIWRPDGPIFPGRDGQWRKHQQTVDPARIRALVRQALPEVDADAFTTHCTRHTMASFVLAASGGDLRRAMELTRHEDVKVFSKYMHRIGRDNTNPMPELGVTWADVLEAPVERFALEASADEWVPLLEQGGHDQAAEMVGEVIEGHGLMMKVHREEVQAQRRREQNQLDKRYRASKATDFATAYATWTAAGRPGKRPSQVTARGRIEYDRARKQHERYGPEKPKFKVPRDVRTWENLVLVVRMLKSDNRAPEKRPNAELMAAWIAELRALNPALEKPRPNVEVVIPREWDVARVAKKAKWRVFGAWAKYLKERSGAQVPQMVSGELSDGPDSENEGNEP